MIVKIQRSVSSSNGSNTILIYNQDRTVHTELDATDDILEMMGSNLKMFCFAELVPNTRIPGTHLVILTGEAPRQYW